MSQKTKQDEMKQSENRPGSFQLWKLQIYTKWEIGIAL